MWFSSPLGAAGATSWTGVSTLGVTGSSLLGAAGAVVSFFTSFSSLCCLEEVFSSFEEGSGVETFFVSSLGVALGAAFFGDAFSLTSTSFSLLVFVGEAVVLVSLALTGAVGISEVSEVDGVEESTTSSIGLSFITALPLLSR